MCVPPSTYGLITKNFGSVLDSSLFLLYPVLQKTSIQLATTAWHTRLITEFLKQYSYIMTCTHLTVFFHSFILPLTCSSSLKSELSTFQEPVWCHMGCCPQGPPCQRQRDLETKATECVGKSKGAQWTQTKENNQE